MGIINLGNGWRKDIVNQCLAFAVEHALGTVVLSGIGRCMDEIHHSAPLSITSAGHANTFTCY